MGEVMDAVFGELKPPTPEQQNIRRRIAEVQDSHQGWADFVKLAFGALLTRDVPVERAAVLAARAADILLVEYEARRTLNNNTLRKLYDEQDAINRALEEAQSATSAERQ